jgi:hypothetical protein
MLRAPSSGARREIARWHWSGSFGIGAGGHCSQARSAEGSVGGGCQGSAEEPARGSARGARTAAGWVPAPGHHEERGPPGPPLRGAVAPSSIAACGRHPGALPGRRTHTWRAAARRSHPPAERRPRGVGHALCSAPGPLQAGRFGSGARAAPSSAFELATAVPGPRRAAPRGADRWAGLASARPPGHAMRPPRSAANARPGTGSRTASDRMGDVVASRRGSRSLTPRLASPGGEIPPA